MLEGLGPLVALRQVLRSGIALGGLEQLVHHRRNNAGVVILAVCLVVLVNSHRRGMEHTPLLNKRRHNHGRNSNTQSSEVKGIISRHLPVRVRHIGGGLHVVEEAAMLVVSDHEHGILPDGRSAQRLINVLDQLFSQRNIVVRVLVSGRLAGSGEICRLDPRELGHVARSQVGREVVIRAVLGASLLVAAIFEGQDTRDVLVVHAVVEAHVSELLVHGLLRVA
mmetsp:Transcript_23715/g.40361  ORF Transcript_23715/g.40361 Transcript_23715/m.40361 type:complete len:223 (+) Transcript_23715:602-1270(+)